jgi:hypothetical protein
MHNTHGDPIQRDQALFGRVGIDLSSINSNKIQVPTNASGLIVQWIPDKLGNASGNIYIWAGEPAGFPWSYIGAPATHVTIARGALSQMSQQGAYLTIVPSAGAQGLLIFEFMAQPPDRNYSTA